MHSDICDFTALAGKTLLKQLDREFQYQMELTDGNWVLWYDTHFKGHCLEPATDVKAQAILQFFGSCACPFSMLRLGRSLSPRNNQHGPIQSNMMAIRYLLSGFECIANNLFDYKISTGMRAFMTQLEFRLAGELLMTYQKELATMQICPEILALATGGVLMSEDMFSRH
ncbi:hypothetical protein P2G88_06675 [Aliiglaciecola sp. CAU 1673]|uniref:hypothetical protein n=1 Tax=Aliiglaciecola sp. CAU 1673 TaxID=3032595 RepID=UPI0023DB30FE|nr:hypothetical protein [Aliiglaciecola sp. CAU 1673]MDF2177931.1 hypothetical protein [Aliiglaciecola sp. CAU 1673]